MDALSQGASTDTVESARAAVASAQAALVQAQLPTSPAPALASPPREGSAPSDDAATPRERLTFLFAYLRYQEIPYRSLPATDARDAPRTVMFLRWITARTRRLLTRRHITEKRRATSDAAQAWLPLDGEALCVTPALQRFKQARASGILP